METSYQPTWATRPVSVDAWKPEGFGPSPFAAFVPLHHRPHLSQLRHRCAPEGAGTTLGPVPARAAVLFAAGWRGVSHPQEPAGRYAGLRTPVLPIRRCPGEDVSEATGRIDQARKLEREITNLGRSLRCEP